MVLSRIHSSSAAFIDADTMPGPSRREVSGQIEEGEGFAEDQPHVPWRKTFNMRPVILATLASGRPGGKLTNSPLNKMRCRLYTGAAKSLDLLRQNLQSSISEEFDQVIQKYLETFFQPAVRNIRENLGPHSVNEDLLREVCRNMLEEAKQMYSPYGSSYTAQRNSAAFVSALGSTAFEHDPPNRKDLEKEAFSLMYQPLEKWNPTRVNKDTLFILSTSAGIALGLGNARSRLTIKHPELVKYMPDQDDREWLGTACVPGIIHGSHNLAIMFLEDVIQVINSFDEYKNSGNLCLDELQGFQLPDFIQRKVRAYMTLMRTKYLPPPPSSSSSSSSSTSSNSTLRESPKEEQASLSELEDSSSSTSFQLTDSDILEIDQYLGFSSSFEDFE